MEDKTYIQRILDEQKHTSMTFEEMEKIALEHFKDEPREDIKLIYLYVMYSKLSDDGHGGPLSWADFTSAMGLYEKPDPEEQAYYENLDNIEE